MRWMVSGLEGGIAVSKGSGFFDGLFGGGGFLIAIIIIILIIIIFSGGIFGEER
ncbi:MAG: hypothetical protein M0Z31_07935 [Clostridia bacterium]|nr:hypothetical protein [Clostridia bacterium]